MFESERSIPVTLTVCTQSCMYLFICPFAPVHLYCPFGFLSFRSICFLFFFLEICYTSVLFLPFFISQALTSGGSIRKGLLLFDPRFSDDLYWSSLLSLSNWWLYASFALCDFVFRTWTGYVDVELFCTTTRTVDHVSVANANEIFWCK